MARMAPGIKYKMGKVVDNEVECEVRFCWWVMPYFRALMLLSRGLDALFGWYARATGIRMCLKIEMP